MEYLLDVYLDDVNKEYLNKLSFLTLFKSRSLGYRCAADMFSEAFQDFSEDISEESMKALLAFHTCRYIAENYEIQFKEDLLYLIRHPSLLKNKVDPCQKPVRKKVLRFFDIEKPGNEHKKAAYDFLDKLRPVKRASFIDVVMDQFLIRSGNTYYVSQASARMIDDLVNKSQFDEEGNILSPCKEIVETIWCVGKGLSKL